MTAISAITALPPDAPKRLASVGIATVEDLRAANASDLAAETNADENEAQSWIDAANGFLLLTDVKGIGPTTAEKFRKAGITTVDELANADAEETSPLVGMTAARVATFSERAQDLLDAPAPEGRPEADDGTPASIVDDARRAAEEFTRTASGAAHALGEAGTNVASEGFRETVALAEDFKVVLKERAHTARVRVGKVVYEDVPIVVARVNEDLAEVRAGLTHDAVILQERASTAVARLGDAWHENVPLVQEKLVTVAHQFEPVVEEVRVKVLAIKDRAREQADKGKGFIGKLFNREKQG